MGRYVTDTIRNHKIYSEIVYGKIDKINWETDEVARKARRHFDHLPDYSVVQNS